MPLGPPNMASTVNRFATPVVRRRFAATTTNSDGKPVRGAETTTPFRAHVWDAPADVLALLPEGGERGHVIQGTTTLELRVDDSATGLPSDVITYRLRPHRVIQATTRTTGPAGTPTVWEFLAEEIELP